MSKSSPVVNRYCCKVNEEIEYDSDGFLSNPESPENGRLSSSIENISSYDEIELLILLGEPGIGKSFVLSEMKRRVDQKSGTSNSVWIDLQQIGSKDDLCSKITDAYEQSDLENTEIGFTIYLDGLDECLERDSLVNYWIAEIVLDLKEKIEVSLRLTCRAMSWPESLENKLTEIFSKISVMELLPLRRIDATGLAEDTKSRNTDSDFFQFIINNRLGTFAARPITLKMLIKLWNNVRIDAKLSKTELYRQSLLHMCQEHSRIRRERGFVSDRTPDELFRIACRIAAITLFCRKNMILEEGSMISNNSHRVSIANLIGGDEFTDNGSFMIEKKDVKDTILNPMFRSIGNGMFEWSHKSFQEFLAAQYLVFYDFPVKLADWLLREDWSGQGRIYPQFYGVSAWLAVSDAEFRRGVIENEPEILQNSDLSLYSDLEMAKLFASIVRRLDNNEIFELDTEIFRNMRSNTARKLISPVILDSSKGIITRRAIMRMIITGPSNNLSEDILSIVLNPDDEPQIRALAVLAIKTHGTTEQILRLKSLLKIDSDQDPRDEIKGNIILSLWPDHISAGDMFSSLTEPKETSFYGNYWIAIHDLIPKSLLKEHIVDALSWLHRVDPKNEDTGMFRELIKKVYDIAFESIELDEVQRFLSKIIARRISERRTALPYYFKSSLLRSSQVTEVNRKLLLERIVKEHKNYPYSSSGIYVCQAILVDDLAWLIKKFIETERREEKAIWMEIVFNTIDISEPSMRATVEKAFFNSELSSKANEWLSANDAHRRNGKPSSKNILDSTNSEIVETNTKFQKDQNQIQSIQSDWLGLLDQILGSRWPYRDHKDESWIDAIQEKFRSLCGEVPPLEVTTKLENYCMKFLGFLPAPENRHYDMGSIYALIYLSKTKSLACAIKDDKVDAEALLGIVIKGMSRYHLANSAITEMVSWGFSKFSNISLVLLETEIIYNINSANPFLFSPLYKLVWDEQIERMCFKHLTYSGISEKAMIALFSILVMKNSNDAIEYAKKLLKTRICKKNESFILRKAIALELMENQPKNSWASIWQELTKNKKFGKELIQAYAHCKFQRDEEFLFKSLSVRELVQLFIWLRRMFPPKKDLKFEKAHAMQKRESVADLRDSIPRYLVKNKTIEAEKEFRILCKKYKEDSTLKWQYSNLLRSLEEFQGRNSRQITPSELLSKIKDCKNDNGRLSKIRQSKPYKITLEIATFFGFGYLIIVIVSAICTDLQQQGRTTVKHAVLQPVIDEPRSVFLKDYIENRIEEISNLIDGIVEKFEQP